MKKSLALSLATLLAVPLLMTQDAAACGMSVRLDPTPQRPTPVQELARAEKALESGQTLAAAQAVLGSFPRVRGAEVGKNPLETRALRVFALVLVRSGGTIDEKRVRGIAATGDWSPKSNLAWAVQALREVDAKRPNDPVVLADLGEALAATPQGKAEALKILQGLADKDLMGSPHAYAALARLKSQTGDVQGAQVALKRCEEMTKSPGVCRAQVAAKA